MKVSINNKCLFFTTDKEKILFLQMDLNDKRETNKKGENNEKEMIDVILFLFDRYI
jgi:hypothetical protein